jgi:hypothetical protein
LPIDDEEAIAKLEKQMFERRGYNVRCCLNTVLKLWSHLEIVASHLSGRHRHEHAKYSRRCVSGLN